MVINKKNPQRRTFYQIRHAIDAGSSSLESVIKDMFHTSTSAQTFASRNKSEGALFPIKTEINYANVKTKSLCVLPTNYHQKIE